MSKACDDALDRIYPFLDGEMTWIHRAKVRWHLRHCPPCGDLYDFEERLKVRVGEGARVDVEDDVVARLKGFLDENGCR